MRLNGSFISPSMNRPTRAHAPGIWGIQEISENVLDTTWPTLTDPTFANNTILIHGDDQEGFAGSLPTTPQHWRNNAGTTHSPAFALGSNNNGVILSSVSTGGIAPKFGSTCMKVQNFGLGTSGVGADFSFGTGDFTIEGWFYFGTLAVSNIIDCRANSGSNGVIPTIYLLSNLGSLRYLVNSADRIVGANGTLVAATWTHIALSRVGGNTYLYANGAQAGATYVDANNYTAATVQAYWGSSSNGSPMTGYMQELRVKRGVGLYSGTTCPVPTQKFPDTA